MIHSAQSPPATLVKGLSHAQLAGLFGKILEKHPEMQEELSEMLPKPDMSAIEERLLYLKRNVYRALPNTR